jgi:hypothetical protein
MTTLNINGQHVNVDDSFLGLSPDEQQSTVDHIAASPSPTVDPVSVNNVARSAATGVPIIGGLLNTADAATNAALAPALNSFFDPKDQLPEDTFAGRYAHSLRDQEGSDANLLLNTRSSTRARSLPVVLLRWRLSLALRQVCLARRAALPHARVWARLRML